MRKDASTMTVVNNTEAAQLISRAEDLGNQFLTDPDSLSAAWENPSETLSQAGLLEHAAAEFLHKYEMALAEMHDVAGYDANTATKNPKDPWNLAIKAEAGTKSGVTISATLTIPL